MKLAIWGEASLENWEDFEEKLDLLCRAGIQRLLPCIYNTHKAQFPSKVAHQSHDLWHSHLLPAAQKRGLEIHAWVMMMRYGADDKEKKAHWFDVNRLGEDTLSKPPYVSYYQWMSPFVDEVCEYLAGLIREIAELEVAGVHLDYIRFCDRFLPPGLLPLYSLEESDEIRPCFDYGYHPEALQAFQVKYGYKPLESDIADEKWQQFRLDAISRIVERCAEIVQQSGKELSAAVFPNPLNAPQMVLQDWGRWPLTAAYPMIYHKFYKQDYHWIASEYRRCCENFGKGKVVPGIYLLDFSPTELQTCLSELHNAGAKEVSLFDMSSLTPELAAVLGEYQ